MRTKSAKQIHEQTDRIIDGMANASWDGKEYENHANLVARLEKVGGICKKYVDNIYKHFGVDGVTCGAKVANELYIICVDVAVYTGKEAAR